MVYLIIFLSLLGLCILLGVANIVVTKVKKKKQVKHSEKGEE